MHPRHQFRRGFLLALQEGDFMRVAYAFKRIVARPPVGMYSAAWLNRLFYELHQAVPGSVRNALHANPSDAGPIFLSRDHNQGLTLRLSASHSLLQTTQIGFVHLHPPRQPIATRPYHRSPELVQPRPRGLIARLPGVPLKVSDSLHS